LIQNLKDQFGTYVEKLKEYRAPASPRSIIKRPDKEDIPLSTEIQIFVQIRSWNVIVFGKTFLV
jgi:hypothetical protein